MNYELILKNGHQHKSQVIQTKQKQKQNLTESPTDRRTDWPKLNCHLAHTHTDQPTDRSTD